MSSKRLNLVVAVCTNKGIGINGRLPWTIKGDMAFFKKITSNSSCHGRQNVVLMGRKTWDSIPAKHRPLPNRINVILSASLQEAPQGSYLIRNFDEVISLMESSDLKDKVNDLFVIGGSSLYTMSFRSSHPVRVYLTTVLRNFECDTFMPEFDDVLLKYRKTDCEDIDSSIRSENGIDYQIDVYDKPDKLSMNKVLAPVKICVAMLENRGIGLDGHLAWPHINLSVLMYNYDSQLKFCTCRKDYDHYMRLTQPSPESGGKVVNIKGRATWDSTGAEERARPNVITIVISKTLRHTPDGAEYLATDFDEAHRIASSLYDEGRVHDIWVMGGQDVYKIHLTQIQASLKSDRFFPEFESFYEATSDSDFYNVSNEDDGILYQFKLYRRLPEFSS